MDFKVISLIVGLVILLFVGGFGLISMYELNENVKSSDLLISDLESNLSELRENNVLLQNKVIGLQENNEYDKIELLNVRESKNELQNVFDRVLYDAEVCYWANFCAYNPNECSEHFKGVFASDDARSIHIHYSNLCDSMIRDWDEYHEFDSFED